MKRYSNIFLILAATVFTGASCRKFKDPKPSESGKLELPEFNDAGEPSANLLPEADGSKYYAGSVIMWHPDVTTEQIEAVLKKSRAYNAAMTSQLQFERDHIRPLREELKTLTSDRDALISEKNAKLYDTRFAVARAWFEEQLGRPELALDADDFAQAWPVFEGYCEAKLWDVALTSSFVTARYSRRPSPMALCQDFYDAKGYMDVGTPECADATSDAGKGYFQCFWLQGVLKTALFARYADRAAELAAIPVDALETDLSNSTRAIRIKNNAMNQMAAVTIGGRPYNFTFPGQDNTAAATLATAAVIKIRDQFSRSLTRRPPVAGDIPALRLVSIDRRDRMANVDDALRGIDALRENVRLFADQINESLLNSSIRVGDAEPRTNADLTAFAAIVNATDPEIDAQIATIEKQSKKVDARLSERLLEGGSVFEAAGLTCADKPENLQCQTQTAFEEQVLAITGDGVGVAMLSSVQLAMERANGYLAVALRFDYDDSEVPSVRACISEKDGSMVDLEECSWTAAQFSVCGIADVGDSLEAGIDLESGKLTMQFEMSNPDLLGWKVREKEVGKINSKFNLLDPDDTAGSVVSLEMYPNRLGDVANVLGGNAKLTFARGDRSGSVSLVEKR